MRLLQVRCVDRAQHLVGAATAQYASATGTAQTAGAPEPSVSAAPLDFLVPACAVLCRHPPENAAATLPAALWRLILASRGSLVAPCLTQCLAVSLTRAGPQATTVLSEIEATLVAGDVRASVAACHALGACGGALCAAGASEWAQCAGALIGVGEGGGRNVADAVIGAALEGLNAMHAVRG